MFGHVGPFGGVLKRSAMFWAAEPRSLETISAKLSCLRYFGSIWADAPGEPPSLGRPKPVFSQNVSGNLTFKANRGPMLGGCLGSKRQCWTCRCVGDVSINLAFLDQLVAMLGKGGGAAFARPCQKSTKPDSPSGHGNFPFCKGKTLTFRVCFWAMFGDPCIKENCCVCGGESLLFGDLGDSRRGSPNIAKKPETQDLDQCVKGNCGSFGGSLSELPEGGGICPP